MKVTRSAKLELLMRGCAVTLRLLLCAAIAGTDFAYAAEPSVPLVEQRDDADQIAAALQTCRSNEFDKFFRLYTQSRAVRNRFTSEQVSIAPLAQPSYFLAKALYLDRLPIAAHGWNFVVPASLYSAKGPDYLLVRTSHVSKTVWRVDWADVRFDTEPPDGKWIGVPAEIRGAPGKLTFVKTDEGCWHLTDEVQAPKDTPFELGVQRLRCTVRPDDYWRELARVERSLPDHLNDMDVGRELAVCLRLLDTIERTIRNTPTLADLRQRIDKRLAALHRRQTPAAQAALELDERRFRRSLMRDQYVLADGTTGDWDMSDDLDQRLRGRLEELERIEPSRQDFEGAWANASGRLDIRRDGSTYGIDANPVDIDFLAWTCEFEGTMHRTKNGLVLDGDEGETVRAHLRGGVLVVDHVPTYDGFIKSCGAGGSISGTYFPIKPVRNPPRELDGAYPPADEFNNAPARP